jgi:hypothetical protein
MEGAYMTRRQDAAALARFDILPQPRPFGPYEGTVRFQIGDGRGTRAQLRRTPLTLRILFEGKALREESVTQIPALFDWDTAPLAPGRYTLELWLGTQKLDSLRATVRGTSAPTPKPQPLTAKFAEHPIAARGGVRLSIVGLPDTLPEGWTPMVRITQVGNPKVLALVGTGTRTPYICEWEAHDLPRGRYQMALVLIDLNGTEERITDTFELDLEASPADIMPPEPRLTAPRVAEISRTLGDPHPLIAAAQWALESGWGQHPSGKNNYFGIKAQNGQAATEKETKEFEGGGWITTRARFADYPTPRDGIAARLAFLKKPRYAAYWRASDTVTAAKSLQAAGYATDPNYAAKLIRLARQIEGQV